MIESVISNPPFIVLYSSLCSLTLRSLRSLRFNHSNATGIDITHGRPETGFLRKDGLQPAD
ncbi:hypothetical protein QUA54_24760 [Microcoleus sp. MOSTC5]|uniref:hypothetical protein n=1 Tax=Microcoleus sp. MOSTC5 TaxID=3055378 RepID=UPI002FD20C1B